ncbi:hypothetical protein BMS3Bbin16_00258 [archaeon BMS3Bbin16]|nr:hypothetical protein BMS3Bbin16_00258 [archaeon BMS3Bbin16]
MFDIKVGGIPSTSSRRYVFQKEDVFNYISLVYTQYPDRFPKVMEEISRRILEEKSSKLSRAAEMQRREVPRKILKSTIGSHYADISKFLGILGYGFMIDNAQAGVFDVQFVKRETSEEISEDVLEQAEELLKSGYKDLACVLAGVALETSLKDLCSRHGIKHGRLNKMNADLRKADAYNVGMQKQITAWAHHRNKAAHGEWGEYTSEDVKYMIRGVRRFIAEYL